MEYSGIPLSNYQNFLHFRCIFYSTIQISLLHPADNTLYTTEWTIFSLFIRYISSEWCHILKLFPLLMETFQTAKAHFHFLGSRNLLFPSIAVSSIRTSNTYLHANSKYVDTKLLRNLNNTPKKAFQWSLLKMTNFC